MSKTIDSFIDRWIEEDLGNGDHTTLSTIPHDAEGTTKIIAKEKGVLAGTSVAASVLKRIDSDLSIEIKKNDGEPLKNGDIVMFISGYVRSILIAERLVLNVMQRMSGIATETARYVERLKGTGTKILDTRKTTPGFRYIEKEAVRIGGGVNHRFGLFDMILIKDNHIDFAGGIEQAIQSAHKYLREKQLHLKIEAEVRSLEDIDKVLKTGGVDRILLDNFSVEMTKTAVKKINGKIETESSGGINLETIRSYAECGVDYISVGALTHHIKSLDLSLLANF